MGYKSRRIKEYISSDKEEIGISLTWCKLSQRDIRDDPRLYDRTDGDYGLVGTCIDEFVSVYVDGDLMASRSVEGLDHNIVVAAVKGQTKEWTRRKLPFEQIEPLLGELDLSEDWYRFREE